MVGQAVWPAEHVWLHTPAEQRWPLAQTVVQLPQCCGSVWKLVHSAEVPVPQAFGVAAGQLHVPLEHVCPAGQTVPHAPQLLASVVVVAQ